MRSGANRSTRSRVSLSRMMSSFSGVMSREYTDERALASTIPLLVVALHLSHKMGALFRSADPRATILCLPKVDRIAIDATAHPNIAEENNHDGRSFDLHAGFARRGRGRATARS